MKVIKGMRVSSALSWALGRSGQLDGPNRKKGHRILLGEINGLWENASMMEGIHL